MSEEQTARIKAIFSRVIGIPEAAVTDETAYNSCEAWDSLKHLEMVAAFESEFGIEMEMDDIIAMENFRKVKEIVLRYLS